ncbi:dioxygenase [Brevibacillus panacihumi W25]|uniref:Dioxygenase n=2 Tax=Brevibacillus panacihumi TaxID=497735 RepID=V6M6G6_9BACL|nr:dioxygenase [Brevibacillus panacihumi W25]
MLENKSMRNGDDSMNKQENSQLSSIVINGHEFTYDIHGEGDGPVLLLLTGWCQDHRLFNYIVQPLAQQHKVLRLNWRGHSYPQQLPGDFGVNEQAEDVIGVLNALDIEKVIPVSTSHGGWANIEITDRLGTARAPQTVVIDWIMGEAGEALLRDLRDIQNPEKWVSGRQSLFDHWLGVSSNRAIMDHLNKEMASFGYDMWERSCRVIEQAYEKWGAPLQRMSALKEKRPIVHIYSQAPGPGYEEMQQSFKEKHSWFDYKCIKAQTHFPTLESPEAVANHIHDFVSQLR